MIANQVKILVLDDDISFLEQMPEILGGFGHVDCYRTIDQGLAALGTTYYDIALLDLNFDADRRSGLDVFKQILSLDRGIDVVMITGEANPRRIFELVSAGIHHLIPKPADITEIRSTVASVLEEREQRRRRLELAIGGTNSGTVLIGSSPQMRQIREHLTRIVENGIKDILLQGETGTGKDVVAREIARLADPLKPLIARNCAGLTETLIQSELFGHVKGAFTGADRDKRGLFEEAAGGYVFLDEIGDMPLSQQPRLLRALQERKIARVGDAIERSVSFRTISASHKDLKTAVETGQFREDLYFRISKTTLTLPPLRQRMEDLPELVEFFLCAQSKKCVVTQDALNLMASYHWPGNIRQLESAVENMVIRADDGAIRVAQVVQATPDLGGLSSTKIKRAVVGSYGLQLIAKERYRFERAIINANGDRNLAAKSLGLPRTTFFRKAKELGLVRSRRKRSLETLGNSG